MVESLHKQQIDTNDVNEKNEKASLWERVRAMTQSTLDDLANWKDALTQKVEITTTQDLNTLHTEIVEANNPEVATNDFEKLKQEVVTQQKKIQDESGSITSEITEPYRASNIAADQNPRIASQENIRKNRAEAANRVATMIEEELLDRNSWTLI